MENRTFDQVISLDVINNLEGPYADITTLTNNYNLRVKKTFIQDVILVNNRVYDFNKAEGYLLDDGTVVFIIDRMLFYGEQ